MPNGYFAEATPVQNGVFEFDPNWEPPVQMAVPTRTADLARLYPGVQKLIKEGFDVLHYEDSQARCDSNTAQVIGAEAMK